MDQLGIRVELHTWSFEHGTARRQKSGHCNNGRRGATPAPREVGARGSLTSQDAFVDLHSATRTHKQRRTRARETHSVSTAGVSRQASQRPHEDARAAHTTAVASHKNSRKILEHQRCGQAGQQGAARSDARNAHPKTTKAQIQFDAAVFAWLLRTIDARSGRCYSQEVGCACVTGRRACRRAVQRGRQPLSYRAVPPAPRTHVRQPAHRALVPAPGIMRRFRINTQKIETAAARRLFFVTFTVWTFVGPVEKAAPTTTQTPTQTTCIMAERSERSAPAGSGAAAADGPEDREPKVAGEWCWRHRGVARRAPAMRARGLCQLQHLLTGGVRARVGVQWTLRASCAATTTRRCLVLTRWACARSCWCVCVLSTAP